MSIMELNGIELDKCPLCASDARLKRSTWEPKKDGPVNDDLFWVKCTNKDCGISPSPRRGQDAAIAAWNRGRM